MPVDHYENFPVASLLVPRRLRSAVVNIYCFARSADDIADEGDADSQTRLNQLDVYWRQLKAIEEGAYEVNQPDSLAHIFKPLATTIHKHQLSLAPFFDLLSAFSQDVQKNRYASEQELLDYCSRSANPVGRLMLQLYGTDTAVNRALSDDICTGLQLANFWQDIAIDWQKQRVYLPQSNMQQYGVTEHHIANGICDAAWQKLMQAQTRQAQTMLRNGFPLVRNVGGRLGLELKLVIFGGLRILERLEQLNYNVFSQRPKLNKGDWVLLLGRALSRRACP
ncbi:MAG: squalene synthase HpnC [Pusillimonas sp.]|jgi:squalene synthase HpnC|nr:squalene synthase HpnC [Pusillimonas sp.]